MLLIKNLNVSNLDKNILKEFDFSESNATVETLINQVATSLNLNSSQIELLYRGEILKRDVPVDKYFTSLNQNVLLFITENRTLNAAASNFSLINFKNSLAKLYFDFLINDK
jgi:hypothetical protein